MTASFLKDTHDQGVMDVQTLLGLGLNKNEAKIYLCLVNLGEASAQDIIKATTFHRNIVYDNLEKLIQQGLVVFIFKGNKRVFLASKANALLQRIDEQARALEQKRHIAQRVVADIEKHLSRQKQDFSAIVYQGLKGVREVLREVCESPSYEGIGVSNASVEVLGLAFWKNFIKRVKMNKTRERLLINSDFNQKLPISSPKTTEIRRLPGHVNLITEIMIFGKKTAIIIYAIVPIALVIENQETVRSFKAYFETLWKQSE